MKKPLIFVAFVALALQASAAPPAPTSFDLPAATLWCVSSQPIDVQADGANGVTFGDLVFQQLYLRLEGKALEAQLDSIGVPFLESATASNPLATATAQAASQAPGPVQQKQFVLRVCAIVPAAAAAPPAGVETLGRPAMTVAAALCGSDDSTGCEDALSAYLKASHNLTDGAVASIDWRVSQPFSDDPSPNALFKSLSDSSLRSLRKEIPQVDPPHEFNIIWTPIPH